MERKTGVAFLIGAALFGAALFCVVGWFADSFIAPLFLNSRIERLGENDLPRIRIEVGNVVYCRMKADDFRFPLPTGTIATNAMVTGGFDTVDGSVEAHFAANRVISPSQYENSLRGRLKAGANVTAAQVPGGLLIRFHYFGDK